MLVLTRRIGEDVILPGVRVRITLLSVSGGRIRLGVAAPRAVEVLRGELAAGEADGADLGAAEPPGAGRETATRRGKARPPRGV